MSANYQEISLTCDSVRAVWNMLWLADNSTTKLTDTAASVSAPLRATRRHCHRRWGERFGEPRNPRGAGVSSHPPLAGLGWGWGVYRLPRLTSKLIGGAKSTRWRSKTLNERSNAVLCFQILSILGRKHLKETRTSIHLFVR